MKIDAIVYTSNTGHTAQYAQMVGVRTGLPVYSAKEAETVLPQGACILYMGWIRASVIAGYREAAARYAIAAIAAVGMGETGGQIDVLRKKNKLAKELPLFTLQGGLLFQKLRGMNAFMINFSRKKAVKILKAERKRSEAQNAMLVMLSKGGSFVQEKHLGALLDWLASHGVTVLEQTSAEENGGENDTKQDPEK